MTTSPTAESDDELRIGLTGVVVAVVVLVVLVGAIFDDGVIDPLKFFRTLSSTS